MSWMSKILWCNSTCVRDFSLLQNIQKSYGPNQPPMQQVLVVKWLVSEECHSTSNSTEVNNEWNYTSATPIRLHGMQRDNINFTSHQWEVKSAIAHINSVIRWAWLFQNGMLTTTLMEAPITPQLSPPQISFLLNKQKTGLSAYTLL